MSINEKMTAIADDIRTLSGKSEPLSLDAMDANLDSVINDVDEQTNLINQITESLRYKTVTEKSYYDTFWDDFQQNGQRTEYNSAFGPQWTVNTWKPKYPICPTNIYMMFFSNSSAKIVIPDFVEYCRENNIVFDLSNASGTSTYALAGLHTNHHGVLDFSCNKNPTKTISLPSLFYSHTNANCIKVIDEFIVSERTIFSNDTFTQATQLEEVTFTGVMASDNFNVSTCAKLTHDSLMSIIDTLKDYSGTTTTKTATLGTTNLAKLSDEEKAIATQKGWTLA